MSTSRVFKRGETIYKEGEKAQSLYLVQSGSVTVSLHRQKQNVELMTVTAGQILGEHLLWGTAVHPHTAVAHVETKLIELPPDGVKSLIETSTQLQKALIKGLYERLKTLVREHQSMKLERDNTPCPPEQCAKIFGSLFHSLKAKGEVSKKDDSVAANWNLLKQYAQRVFLESPKRLEMACNIFVKLGWAKYVMAKPEDGEGSEVIDQVVFTDLAPIEGFFDFYQYYYFKGGKQEILKTDDRAIGIVAILLELTAGQEADRQGLVKADYAKIIEKVKEKLSLQLNSDHWTLLENKGLMVKRESNDKGITLQFELKEFERMAKVWKVLREVEKWNDKGVVELVEAPPPEAKKTGPACPACGHGYEGAPKFCSECGHKFAHAA